MTATAGRPCLRLVHSADWHLGQTLHGIDRGPEHDRFLDFLIGILDSECADALVVAGDVFDSASPSAAAQQRYYGFLAELRRALPRVQVVIVGGNHDSPARLDAPAELLRSLGVRVVGGLHGGPGDLDSHLIPLSGKDGAGATLMALPFLRPRDVSAWGEAASEPEPSVSDPERGDAAAIGRFVLGYERLVTELHARTPADLPRVATGHCYLAGAATSDDSERKIQMGNQAALPAALYLRHPMAYVALGHLHRAQAVEADHVRYSGSPIPLSLAERSYSHQVLRVDVPPGGPAVVEPRFVPRSVPFLRVPDEPAPLEGVEAALRALPRPAHPPPEALWPVLEVAIRLDGPEPQLKARIQAALNGAPVRLARIAVEREVASPAPAVPSQRLEDLSEGEVFRQAYVRARGHPPSAEVAELFAEVQHAVDAAGANGAEPEDAKVKA